MKLKKKLKLPKLLQRLLKWLKSPHKKKHPQKSLKPSNMAAKKWIQGAVKKPGALHKELGVKMGKKIPAKMIAKAATKGGKLGARARLSQTLKKMH